MIMMRHLAGHPNQSRTQKQAGGLPILRPDAFAPDAPCRMDVASKTIACFATDLDEAASSELHPIAVTARSTRP